MQLIQRNDNGQAAQVLPMGDNQIVTGNMGDCVSVIVLYNPGPNGRYANARGYHGGGGLGNVNFASLFNGVPNVGTTQVIIISGTLQASNFASTENRERVRNEAIAAGLGNVMVRNFHGYGNARVDRLGNVTPI